MRGKQKPKRRVAKPAKAKVRAKRPASGVGDLEKRLAESLAQQAATAEILRVIGSSPTDVQPVFDTIVRSAVRLCDGLYSALFQFDGELIRQGAQHNIDPKTLDEVLPVRPSRAFMPGRAILERAVVHIPDVERDPEFRYQSLSRAIGLRSGIWVPMLREGNPIGVIAVTRAEPGPFSDSEIGLLKTFADQAVIAIENVRLFTELEARNREVTEALDQKTATSEILRVISSSPTDVQPVFDAIAQNSVRLCDGVFAAVFRFDGELMHFVAHHHFSGAALDLVQRQYPRPPKGLNGSAILDRAVAHSSDVLNDPRTANPDLARVLGYRSLLAVPILREGQAIGAIVVYGADAVPFPDEQIALLKTFADQAVIAIENVRLFTELREKNEALTLAHAQVSETLEQQTATAEILRVISSSPTDVQPVFDVIVERAVHLCGARFGRVYRFDDGVIHMVAGYGLSSVGVGELQRILPRPASDDTIAGRVILSRQPAFVHDIERDEGVPALSRRMIEALGTRSQITIPMLRAGEPIGAMTLGWAEPEAFDEQQIALVKTFADQAVIAIENVRLFTELGARNAELTEALTQQTATSEVLGVISRSPTDIQPVLDTVVESAARLCEAHDANMFLRRDNRLVLAAYYGPIHDASAIASALGTIGEFTLSLDRGTLGGRTVLDARTVHIADVQVEAEEFPEASENARRLGFHTMLSVPLMREGVAIGAIQLPRTEVRPFTERQVALLKTFADQAVIAIENVRLFTELQASNRDLTSALDTQTATSDILRVISQSQTNVQPVFDAIVASAVRLLGAYTGALTRVAGDQLAIAALTGHDAAADAAVRATFPMSLQSEAPLVQAIRDRAPLNIADYATDPRLPEGFRASAAIRGYRSLVGVPMLLHDEAVGTISVTRREPGGFTGDEIALLKTFADQAVIAIENARLLSELQQKNESLTQAHAQVSEALEQQTATAEILRVISRSQTDVQPVFDTIVRSAVRLCNGQQGTAWQFDGELMDVAAHDNLTPENLRLLHQMCPMRPDSRLTAARAILTREVVHVEDVLADPEYAHPLARAGGFRSVLAVPMLRETNSIGAIVVHREQAGPFPAAQIELLKTFADQAVIAVENVRLFTELQSSNRDLTSALDTQTATSDILRVISRSQTNVQPVFDAIVASAVRLLGGHVGSLTRVAGDQIELAALTSNDAGGDATLRASFPRPLQSEGGHNWAIRDRAAVNIADAQTDSRLPEFSHASARARGYRSLVVVPLLRHSEAIGTISVTRREAGGFTDDEIALLKTFADQAVIAIENARLLSELQQRNEALTQAHAQVSEALEQQTATAEILRAISSSPTDARPVFETIAKNARRLCKGDSTSVLRLDGTLLHLETVDNATEEGSEALRRAYPSPVSQRSASGRAVLTGRAVHIPDVLADPGYEFVGLQGAGLRSILSVPMLRHGTAIGAITVHTWATVRPFSSKQIELLQTFADQAVIAIENTRLFKELEARTTELTRSVDQLTALGEISQAVSSTLDVETVLQTIVSRASQLAGADGCAIYEYDASMEAFHIRATHNLGPALVARLRASPLHKGEGAMGRAAETREPTQVADIAAPGAYQSHIRNTLLAAGYRALLSVPLLREGEIIGSLSLNRHVPGEFPPEAVEVLKTFATQSALAIQNARLFHEIADKSRQLESASRHKSEFLANMSHELRTPLNAIIGFSEVLNERMFGELNDKQAEYLRDIHASGTHLLSLINDILDLSKVEAGRMELELTDFDLPSAMDNAVTLVRERASRKGVTVRIAAGEQVGMLRGDERKIRQVLLNLLSNAIKFTPEGGSVEVAAVPNGGSVEVSVRDTGVGIAPEDQQAVFEEFRQVGASAAKQEGTGLGLALCRKFVELHGGKIWVKSQVGAGSTFTFTLPVQQPSGA